MRAVTWSGIMAGGSAPNRAYRVSCNLGPRILASLAVGFIPFID